ncbi:MAG: Aldo-keto reductase YhdN [Gemmatimonadaceae bacterium]|nr:Aldo-keto reductase YhdN [Gemmatimonadaceae bacterium]
MECERLASGACLPRIVKGGWQLAGGHGPVDRRAAVRDMFAFAEHGITAFDCADIYTGVETLIGAFLREWRYVYPSRADAIRVHTKCVPDLDGLPTLNATEVRRIVDRSRRRLGLDTLHLVQLHWWDYEIPGVVRAAEYLTELRVLGIVQDIGVTNFNAPQLERIVAAGVPVVTHQLQYSLLDRRPAGVMTRLCASAGIRMLAYGSLAGGFLSDTWRLGPEPHDPMENRSLTKYKLILDEFGGWERYQQLLDVMHDVATAHGVTSGAIAIRWVLDRPGVAAAIVGARDTSHLDETLRTLSIALTDNDRALLERVFAMADGPSGDVYDLERLKGGKHAAIMRYNLNAASE